MIDELHRALDKTFDAMMATDLSRVQFYGAAREASRELAARDAEIERLKEALRQIDRLAYSHVKGAMQKAQQIARAALNGENPPTP